jgi:hypothetical protein
MKLRILAPVFLLLASAHAQAAKPESKINPATAGKTLSAQDAKASPSQRQLIEFYERELLKADKARNWDAVARRLADDFVEVAGDGNYYRKEQIAKLFPESKVTGYKISEIEFRSLGATAAMLAYRLDLQATFRGTPLPPAIRVSTVWRKQAGAWKVVFHQGTAIAGEGAPKQ